MAAYTINQPTTIRLKSMMMLKPSKPVFALEFIAKNF
jgi:hypothetical protein